MDLSTQYVAPQAPALPARIVLPVDLVSLISRYGEASRKEGRLEARDRSYMDYGNDLTAEIWTQIDREVDRLQGNDWAHDVLLAAMKKIAAEDAGGFFEEKP